MSEANINSSRAKRSSGSTARRIAFVSDAIYPYNKGGKETRLFQISTRLAKRGYDVHIYTMQWWTGGKEKTENGVHLHAISPLYPLYDGPRRSIKQGILFGLSCFKLISEDFDVVDVDHMPFFPLYSMRIVCWIKGKKMSATWHEVWGKKYWNEYLPGIKGSIAAAIESVSFSLPDRIIAVSDMTARRIKEMGFSGEILTIPNGIDMDAIKAVQPSKTQSDVIYAGRLLKHKHVDVLIEAIAIVKKHKPTIQCILVGDGPEAESIREQIKTLKLEKNVTLLPFQSDISDTYALMKASKVFVLPSTREGFGLVVLEANACGIPVITIDHEDNAAKDLIKDENGAIVALSATKVADSIEIFLDKKKKLSISVSHSFHWKEIEEEYTKECLRV